MFIAAYVGARPLGRPLPPLASAPQHPSVPLHLIYSFARDAVKDGRFEFYDPWQLEAAARQQCGNQRGMLSLAGANFSWGPAVGLDEWVANAVDTLQGMLDKYKLIGLDVNYEEGLDERGGFAEAMAALIAQLKAWRPSLLITIAPYTCTWRHYRHLLHLAGPSIDFINWQLYAELEEPQSTAEQGRGEAIAVYDRLAGQVGGYSKLTLGINTEPEPAELRGPRLEACLAAFRVLKRRGIGGAFVWALDNSCLCGYQAETALLRIAGEPAEHYVQHQHQQWQPGGMQQAANEQVAPGSSGSACCCIC